MSNKKLTQEVSEYLLSGKHYGDNLPYMKYKLTESFLIENQSVLNWSLICWYQKLSTKFIKENENLIDFVKLLENPYIKTYDEDFILYKILELTKDKKTIYSIKSLKVYFTPYMLKQYNKYKIMI